MVVEIAQLILSEIDLQPDGKDILWQQDGLGLYL